VTWETIAELSGGGYRNAVLVGRPRPRRRGEHFLELTRGASKVLHRPPGDKAGTFESRFW
jgi:hypothetical protein